MEWHRRNPEKRKAILQRYYQNHKAKINTYAVKWRKENLQRVQELERARFAAQPEKMYEKGRKYRLANKQKRREIEQRWRVANKLKALTIGHRYRSKKTNAPGSDYTTSEHIKARWEMFGNRCWICRDAATQTDHVKPLSKGGSHWPANLRPICKSCNSRKKNRWPIFIPPIVKALAIP